MELLSWYIAKGSAGTDLDSARNLYFRTKSGQNTSTNSMIISVLNTLGYTGDLNSMLKAFYAAKTGLPVTLDFDYLETQFYLNTTYDFSAGVGGSTTRTYGLLLGLAIT